MTDIEIALTNVGEIATRDIAKEEHQKGVEKEEKNKISSRKKALEKIKDVI